MLEQEAEAEPRSCFRGAEILAAKDNRLGTSEGNFQAMDPKRGSFSPLSLSLPPQSFNTRKRVIFVSRQEIWMILKLRSRRVKTLLRLLLGLYFLGEHQMSL